MNNENSPESAPIPTDDHSREPADTPRNENRYADPASDADPRTSDEGASSVGATDLNADNATADNDSPEAVLGVRRG